MACSGITAVGADHWSTSNPAPGQAIAQQSPPGISPSRTLVEMRQKKYKVQYMAISKPTATETSRRHPQRIIHFLTQEECKRLLAVITTKRDRAIFLLAYRHGLR